jgi:competence protein ComEC
MFRWTPYALVRIALFFVAGILSGIYVPDFFSQFHLFVVCLTLTVLYFIVFLIWRSKALASTSGVVGLVTIFLFGYAHVLFRTDARQSDSFVNNSQIVNAYVAVVRSVPEEKVKSWKVEVDVISFLSDGWNRTRGKVILYVSKDAGEPKWNYGDQIFINGTPQKLKPPANPGEFDFKRFLSFKNIYYQHFVREGEFAFLAPTQKKGFVYYSHQARKWAARQLDYYIEGTQQQAIAQALVLGVTDGIDNDLLSAYSASGALHVLSVSGLHVGIIYVLLLFLLKPLQKFSWSRWLVAAISLLCLWTFAFVTGLSPSVLRAVTMFSFVAVARPFGVRTNIYNTLAASAFVLLIYNPYLIMSVGFQLSYLAVLGIVYIQRPLYQLWEIENRIGDWVWQITCVSIAAQVATFALGLLYFHQFPVYFLISNLFVIPISTFVLVIGIVLLTVSGIPIIATIIGKITWGFIWLLNKVVFVVEDLPLSIINNIYFTTLQCWVLMGMLAGIIFLFEFRNIQWLFFSAGCTLWFTILQWLHFADKVDQHQFAVYQINQHSASEWLDDGQSYFTSDSSLRNDEERIRFHIRPNRLIHGVDRAHSTIPFQQNVIGGTISVWREKSFFHLHQPRTLPENLKTDFLIVSHQSLPIFKTNAIEWNVNQLIADGSNSARYIEQLRTFASANNIPFYSTAESGAFILKN